ncbi:unnamed protein product, partial [Clonostachys chloroleuca]
NGCLLGGAVHPTAASTPKLYFESIPLTAILLVKTIHTKSPITSKLLSLKPTLRFQTFNFAKMKFFATTILIAATSVVANYDPCPPLFFQFLSAARLMFGVHYLEYWC